MIKQIRDVTLTVADLERAVRFYEGTLGLMKKYQFSDYAGFECGGVELGLKTWGGLELPREGTFDQLPGGGPRSSPQRAYCKRRKIHQGA